MGAGASSSGSSPEGGVVALGAALSARAQLSRSARKYRAAREGEAVLPSKPTTRRPPALSAADFPLSGTDGPAPRRSSPFSPKRSPPPGRDTLLRTLPRRGDAARRRLGLQPRRSPSHNRDKRRQRDRPGLPPSPSSAASKTTLPALHSLTSSPERAPRPSTTTVLSAKTNVAASTTTTTTANTAGAPKMSRERIRELRFSRWARRRASLDGGILMEEEDLETVRVVASNSRNIGRKRPRMRGFNRKNALPRPPAPVLALSTATSLVVRWLAGQHPQLEDDVRKVDFELQCRIKNSTSISPTWYTLGPSKPAPPTHPNLKLAMRSAARTATLSGLTTFCEPLAFRVRMTLAPLVEEQQPKPEPASVIKSKSAWSDTSDWMQTSPNKPARPTSLVQNANFTSPTSIGVSWSAPQDNGAAVSSYTLAAAREDGKEFTVYTGGGTTCVVGKPSPAPAFAHSAALSTQLEAPHTLARPNPTRIRVRPGETLVFRLTARNSVGDSVPSSPVAMRALPPKSVPSRNSSGGSNQGGGEAKVASSPSSSLRNIPATSLHCGKGHTLVYSVGMKHVCDVCGKRGTAFRCEIGCDWDACQACTDMFEKGLRENLAGKGASNIMRKWRQKARQSSIRAEHEQRQRRQQQQQQHAIGPGETKWEMPTQPTRICQLPNGWIECWDPATEHCYYHDPRRNVTQWEHPCPSLVAPTFAASDLFLEPTTPNSAASASTFGSGPDAITTAGSATINRQSTRSTNVKRPALPPKDAPFRQKRFKFLWHIRGTPTGSCKMLPINMSRENLVYRSFAAFQRIDGDKLRHKFRITYDGEVGIDSGGLTKDWFLEISNKLVDPRYALFRKVDSSAGAATCFDIDPRSGVNDQHLKYFRFFGRLLSKAIYDRHLIDVNFSDTFFKRLLPGFRPSLNLLEKSDPEYYASLRWLLDYDGTDEDFSALDLTFSIYRPDVAGVGQEEIALVPGGTTMAVTVQNRNAYVDRLVAWYCTEEIAPQVKALCDGFHELMPAEKVGVFTSKELSLLIGGKATIGVDELRNLTIFKGGYEPDSAPVLLFWKVLGGLDDEVRGRVLRFITGTTRIPLDGFDPCFQICRATAWGGDGADVEGALPSAHTCFNQLVLPPYQSEDKLREKLMFAIEESSGFHMT